MKKEYENNALVKSLQNAGFTDEWIESKIESGDIKIEKSKSVEEMEDSNKKEKENIEDDKKHIDDLKKDEKEDKEDETLLKKDEKEKEKEKPMEKAVNDDLMKSINALPNALTEAISPLFKAINSRLDDQEAAIKKMSESAPSFKGANLNAGVIEKSLTKDSNGKIELNVLSQRPLIHKVVEKVATKEGIEKSIQDQALQYLMNPEATTVGEELAMYMYKEENIALVK